MRPSTCTGFFCQSTYGEKGLQFWKTLEEVLHYIEACLSQEYMQLKGYEWSEIERNISMLKDGNTESEFDWAHIKDKASYYKGAWEFVNGLKPEVFNKIIGEKGRLLFRVLEQSSPL